MPPDGDGRRRARSVRDRVTSPTSHSHVAFLRAINVGRRRITNVELEKVAGGLGFSGAEAYQASGNLLITSAEPSAEVEDRLDAGMTEVLGYEVTTFVRSAAQLQHTSIVEAFDGQTSIPTGKAQIILVKTVPDAETAAAVGRLSTADDRLAVEGLQIHWRPTSGISTSDLDLPEIGRLVGPMTVRTLGTVQRLADRLAR